MWPNAQKTGAKSRARATKLQLSRFIQSRNLELQTRYRINEDYGKLLMLLASFANFIMKNFNTISLICLFYMLTYPFLMLHTYSSKLAVGIKIMENFNAPKLVWKKLALLDKDLQMGGNYSCVKIVE